MHRYFGEECSFFFLRFRSTHGSPNSSPLDRTDAWLNRLQITSKYLFLLFGHYDVLMRVWALPGRMANLRKLIRQEEQELVAAREFRVTHARLMLNLEKVTEDDTARYRQIQSSLAAIRQVALHPNVVDEKQVQPLLLLLQSGLTHLVSSNTSERRLTQAFRFAIIIQLDTVHAPQINLQQLHEFVVAFNREIPAQSRVIRCAIYHGIGFGDFLVSGLVANHETLISLSEALTSRFTELGVRCRTETHVTATSRSIEFDIIDPSQVDSHPAETRMIDFLSSPQVSAERLAGSLRTMSSTQRQALIRAFETNEMDFVQSDFSIYFKDFLLSRALGDQRYLQRALTCLLEIEGLIVDFWYKGCIERRVQEVAIQFAKETGLAKVDLKKLALGDVRSIAGKFSAREEDWVKETLNVEWLQIIDEIWEVRNDVAHGKLYVAHDYLERNWEKLATKVSNLGTLYNKLRSACARDGATAGTV